MDETTIERYRRLASERLEAIESMRDTYGGVREYGGWAEDYHAEEVRLIRLVLHKNPEYWTQEARTLVEDLWEIEDDRMTV